MNYWNYHMTAGGRIFLGLMALLFFVLIVLCLVWLVKALFIRGHDDDGGSGSESASGDTASTSQAATSAREILDLRLASGEITLDKYKGLRAAINAKDST
jgi:uncharacterized membrane protein